jgi:putative phosphoesterase
MLSSLGVDAVLHCGDIGSPDIVPLFAQWPTHFVFGNVDYDVHVLRAAIDAAGQTCHGLCGDLILAGARVGFLHGHDGKLFEKMIASGDWQLICYGHTHVAERHQEGPTWVLNPGALYRADPHSLAVVDLPDLEIHQITL